MEKIALPAYEGEWHFASMQYGDYIGFNGSEVYGEVVEAILGQPHDFLLLNISGCAKPNFLNYDIFNRSFRPSTNGINYDWYIRFRGEERKDIISFVFYVFIHAIIFNHFIKQKRINNYGILESLPILMGEYTFAIKDPKHNIASKGLSLDSIGSCGVEINDVSLLKSHNEIREETIAKKVIEMLEQSSALNKSEKNIKSDEEIEKLQTKIVDLNILTEDLQENILTILRENDDFRKEIQRLNSINGKIKDSQLESKKNIFRSFTSMYKGFYFPKGIENLYQAISSNGYDYHLNDLKNNYQSLVGDRVGIDDVDSLVNIDGLKTWYKPRSRSDSGFMISYVNNFGNDSFYIYFADDLKANDDWYFLENNDPPRDNFEKILTSSQPLS